MDYQILKLIHVISATILFGTGIGSAFYYFTANRSGQREYIYFATKYVVMADYLFTLPAIIIQIISGLLMVEDAGYSYFEIWIWLAICLYIITLISWLIVVTIQINMKNIAADCYNENKVLPENYWKLEILWVILGALAFIAMISIFYLMVMKPS